MPLASGENFKVGSAIPASVDVDLVGTARVRLKERPVGLFRGADSMRVDTSFGGIVTQIIIDYPDTVSASRLAAGLQAVLGPPTSISRGRTINDEPQESFGWVDRFDVINVWSRDGVRISIGAHRPPR